MKQMKKILAVILIVCIGFGTVVYSGTETNAATALTSEIYLTQTQQGTCTLCSAAMMLRAKAYLGGNSNWSMITENGIRSKAWAEGAGLLWSWSYSIGDCSFYVSREGMSGVSVGTLKGILDRHPEGIVLYCKSVPHAVFLTDYEGDTFYCADTTTSKGGSRIPLSSSYLASKLGGQASILANVSAYWYVSSSHVPSHVEIEEPTGLPYLDIYKSDWYFEAVKYMYETGIMTGISETVFAPAEEISRGQFALILYRLEGSPKVVYKKTFEDVPSGTWYTDAVMWANDKGIINGYENGKFGAADPVTREQIATMLYRYAMYRGCENVPATLDGYIDAAYVSPFAVEALTWAVGMGVLKGKDDGIRLAPLENTVRAECAVLVQRFGV